MSDPIIEVDYLIVGAGATGLAFADSLVSESNASIAIVDDRAHPGGHWNDAYRFVRLHQPSAFYGVGSTPLGRDAIETTGSNAGLYELATGAEICAYFDHVMRRVLLPSGRVQYFPDHRFSNGRCHRLPTGERREIRIRKKLVDATLVGGPIPATHTPNYDIAPGMRHIPVNGLKDLNIVSEAYAIIGGGKTAIDACLWLLRRGVDPSAIRWIRPQDSWLVDRAHLQPADTFFEATVGSLAAQMETIATSSSLTALFQHLEARGQLLRLDPDVEPTAFRCATITIAELKELRRIETVIRMGRVRAIERDRIVMTGGEVAAAPDWVYVDCSAKGLETKAPKTVFEPDRINLQMVRTCQPCFSAALIGFLEAHSDDDAYKNTLCVAIPMPQKAADWLSAHLANAINAFNWSNDARLSEWLGATRLNATRALSKPPEALTPAQRRIRDRLRAAVPGAVAGMRRLLAEPGLSRADPTTPRPE